MINIHCGYTYINMHVSLSLSLSLYIYIYIYIHYIGMVVQKIYDMGYKLAISKMGYTSYLSIPLCWIKIWIPLRQYSTNYLKYGFLSAPNSQQQHVWLLCNKVFTNEAMKPCKLRDHLDKMHPNQADKDLIYIHSLQRETEKRQLTMFYTVLKHNPALMVCIHHINSLF